MCLSNNRSISEKMRAPRALFLKFPYGATLGEPGAKEQHRAILRDAFRVLKDAREAGYIEDSPYRWRRTDYPPIGSADW